VQTTSGRHAASSNVSNEDSGLECLTPHGDDSSVDDLELEDHQQLDSYQAGPCSL